MAMRDKSSASEVAVEHATLIDLIVQVQGVEPDGEMFDAKIVTTQVNLKKPQTLQENLG